MYRKILAPLDGSELSECSLEQVRTIATACHVPEVVLFRVVEPLHPIPEVGEDFLVDAEKRAKSAAAEYLAAQAAKMKKDGVSVTTSMANGRPAEEILDFAAKNKVDLIVMSTHGRSGVTRWAMGSTADRVARHSPAPVLLASPKACRA